MGRPHRNLTRSNRVHVINHVVDGQDLFAIDDDWRVFESILGTVCNETGLRINAYALMSNHYHLLVDLTRCERPQEVSGAIGVLQSRHAKYFNRRTERRGPLFEPRFLDFPVEGIDMSTHLADLTGYSEQDLLPLDGLAPRKRTTLDMIEAALVAVAGAPQDAKDRGRQLRMAAMLGLDLRAADVLELADRFDLSPTYRRRLAHQARSWMHDDPAFASFASRKRQARSEQHELDAMMVR